VVREAFDRYSSWRGRKSLDSYLRENGVVGIQGIDTRALVKKIREKGAIRGIITTEDLDPGRGGDWVLGEGYPIKEVEGPLVAVVDFGVKRNILRRLTSEGARVAVIPPSMAADFVRREKPSALFLSNGPGDPERVVAGIRLVREFMGRIPIFGICLGCQIIGLALGGRTYKLKFGHHGGNHPVKDLRTGRVEITAQNHNFALDPESLPPEVEITHLNLLDETVEGIRHRDLPLFAVQYHPENSPGPHDSYYLFSEFVSLARAHSAT